MANKTKLYLLEYAEGETKVTKEYPNFKAAVAGLIPLTDAANVTMAAIRKYDTAADPQTVTLITWNGGR